MTVLINITVIVLLIYSSYLDIKKRKVSNKICLCIAVLVFLNFSFWNLLGLIPAFVVLIIALYGGIGGGDVKIIAALSLHIGCVGTMIMLLCANTVMLIFYFIIKLIKKEKTAKQFPFVPFILLGYLTSAKLLF